MLSALAMNRFVVRLGLLTALLIAPRPATEAAELTIDPAQSFITLSGSILGTDIVAQGPGSLTTRFGGVIRVTASADSIRFPGGSLIDAMTNGVWAPNVGGGSGAAPADFAGEARSFLAAAKGAFRDIVLDLTSDELPLVHGEFEAAALVFRFPADASAALDYDLGIFKDALPLTGVSTNRVTQAGTLKLENGRTILTIEVNTEYAFNALSAGDAVVRLNGRLVAVGESTLRIGFIARDGQAMVISVPDASASLRLQSTTDFTTWREAAGPRTVAGGNTVFRLETEAGRWFFRAVK